MSEHRPTASPRASGRETDSERLREAEETLAAIRADRIDGFVVATPSGDRVVLTDRGVERPYRLMVDGMSEGAATIAPDGTVLYANARLAAMLGAPLGRILGTSLLAFADPRDAAALRDAFEHGADAEWRGEVLLRAADGGEVPVLLSLTPLRLEPERVVLSLLLSDLREQKRTDAVVAAGQLANRILEQASEAIVVCDEGGRVRQTNRVARRLRGGGDPRGLAFTDAFRLEFDEPGSHVADVLAGHAHRVRARSPHPDGTLHLMVSSTRLSGAEGQALGTVVTLTDLTDLHHATRRLERHARQQRCTAELGRTALAGLELPELARACVEALNEVLEGARATITGAFVADAAVEPRREPRHAGVVRRAIRTLDDVLGELEVDPGPGRTVPSDDVGFVDNVTSLLCLAAEHQVLHDRLHHQAHHDALTGLPNRVLLEDRLQQAMARATRDGTSVAVLFIDLDRFKHVNDTLGHQAGNEVLVQIGRRLREHVREADTVARLGGDEFVLVHGDLAAPDEAIHVAKTVTDALARPFSVGGQAVTLRATVGISTFPRDGAETTTLITKSDSAMYHGKRGGRNMVRFFTERMNEVTAARLELERDFQAALADGQLELMYQPQVDTCSGTLRGLEALARWKHPLHGWIPPARFVPVAEELGLVADLGTWALGEACRRAARWVEAPNGPARVSVNVSPTQFAQPDFVETVEAALRNGGLEATRLELEVTESIMMHDIDTVTRRLSDLRSLGVRIALDDFGLGYSSVSYLRSLPLDRLKIDRSFVDTRSGENAPRDQMAVLTAITTMAQALGLQVTVEGVETDAELDLARSVGCDEVQGFLFGRPEPAAAIDRLLAP